MNFTIADCMSRINQALNYPALSYEDVSHFFDQAISELNTILRISLPSVTEMRTENTFKVTDSPYCVALTTSPATSLTIPITETDLSARPSEIYDHENKAIAVKVAYYIDSDDYTNNTLCVKRSGVWVPTEKVYGFYAENSSGCQTYAAVTVGYDNAYWVEIPNESVAKFSLTDYLPTDWIILFIIPYVCFKFAVRNGDNGALFSDEFTQGLQQLQTAYNVPNFVELSKVAHLSAYKDLVKANLNDLRKQVGTRAITESMKVPNGIGKTYFSVLDSGGWDV